MIIMRLVPESITRLREVGGLDASEARKNSKSPKIKLALTRGQLLLELSSRVIAWS